MFKRISPFFVSLALHAAVMLALGLLRYSLEAIDPELVIESAIEPERVQEDFTRELEVATEASESMNVVAGGAVTGAIGGSDAPAIQQSRVEVPTAEARTVEVNVSELDLTGILDVGNDLGNGEITGETGAVVDGYGTALSRIAQELMRHMRKSKCTVVWLFDESESMNDDRVEIAQQFQKVYEELRIAQLQDQRTRGQDVLLTAVHSFGANPRQITPKLTSDLAEIRSAIDKIPNDPSGIENTCKAIQDVIARYGNMARRSGRQLLVIVVTDESGDDGQDVDSAIDAAKRMNVPVYVLGREAIFGYQYGRIRWRDPQYGLDHWLVINRGPETARPEALQYDGLHARWDAHSSGFGPYEQARITKETGGIFFILPHEEENLVGQEALEKRKFLALDMKEYEPWLVPRRQYEQARDAVPFRKTVADVVRLLDPEKNPQLNVQEIWYPADASLFSRVGKENFDRAVASLALLDQAAEILLKLKPEREKESNQRWRANYDLILAQTLAYRVRLFQVCLALDAHERAKPAVRNPKNNAWNLVRVAELLPPDPEVVKRTKVDLEKLKAFETMAREQFQFVIRAHPRTPWSNRAEYELQQGFGIKFVETFRDPRYDNLTAIQFPKL